MTNYYLGLATPVTSAGCVLSRNSEQVNTPEGLPATKALIKKMQGKTQAGNTNPAFRHASCVPRVAHAGSLVLLTTGSDVGADD